LSDEQIARVYAAALFAAASEAGAVAPVRAQLSEIAAALAASEPLQSVLGSPRIESAAKRRLLVSLTEGADKLLTNALQLLVEKHRISLLAAVQSAYEVLAAQQARTLALEVTSAVALDADLEREIVARVEGTTGKKVQLIKRVDAAVLGGLVLRLDDMIVDSSLRAHVGQLRQRLITAEVRGGE
jgi:F-type H+-transporting ATPase subunit delta